MVMITKFKPAFGMGNRHIQTLYSSFFRKEPQPQLIKEDFILPDGDFVQTYWHTIHNSQEDTPCVILFHGLAGSYQSPYIQGVMNSLARANFNSVLMSFRGCGDKMNSLPRSYHSGETGDANAFIQSVHARFPKAKLYGVGYSLGGNMLLKLQGELQHSTLLSGVVSASAPLQLDICAEAIDQGFSKIYQNHLMKDLKKALLEKYTLHPMESLLHINEKEVKKLKTFWDFDGAYTAPIHGFSSAQDYYTRCSAKQFLKDIQVPTLIIHSKDDPFMNTRIIPSDKELSKNCTLELSEHGGHVGFISGTLLKPTYWLENRIVEFFQQINTKESL